MTFSRETSLDKFLQEHPEGCEISFRAGWYAAKQERHPEPVTSNRGPGLNDLVTQQYEAVKALVLKGLSKSEACKMIGMHRDAFCRRQRIEWYGRDRPLGSRKKKNG